MVSQIKDHLKDLEDLEISRKGNAKYVKESGVNVKCSGVPGKWIWGWPKCKCTIWAHWTWHSQLKVHLLNSIGKNQAAVSKTFVTSELLDTEIQRGLITLQSLLCKSCNMFATGEPISCLVFLCKIESKYVVSWQEEKTICQEVS